MAACDLAVIFACFVAGRAMNYLVSGLPWHATWYHWRIHYGDTRLVIFVALGLACVFAFWRLGHYARRRPFWQELGDVLGVVLTLAILDAALVFLTKTNFSRLWWAHQLGAGGAAGAAGAARGQARPDGPRRLAAPDRGGRDRPQRARRRARAGERGAARLRGGGVHCSTGAAGAPAAGRPAPAYLEVAGKRLPVLRAAPYPDLLPGHLGRPHVVVALELDELARCGGYVERLNLHYGDVDVVSPMRGLPLAGTRVTHFFSHDVLSLRLYNNLARPWPRRLKRAFDLVVGGLLFLLVAPLFALLSWQVARTGRPVLYRHLRIGKGGRRVRLPQVPHHGAGRRARCWRRISPRAPRRSPEWERDHKLKDDPRITRFGAWLRRTSLDELPQLINVLRGEMSLVGPRPVVAAELARYGDNIVYYVESTPGLTGLWQVSGRNDLDYRRRVHLDCWYVKNWSLVVRPGHPAQDPARRPARQRRLLSA